MTEIEKHHHQTFESIRHQDEQENEFWLARELAIVLEYIQWRNFVQVIDKAKEACENSEQNVEEHFADFSKMIGLGKGAQRSVDDYMLSRYACAEGYRCIDVTICIYNIN